MAEIIRPQSGSIQSNTKISTGLAASTASAAQGIGNASVQLGRQQAQSQTGAINNALGNAIAGESLQQLQATNESIKASIYADRMSGATKEFLSGSVERASQKTDDKGNPLFGSLVEDVGMLGKATLEKYLADVTDPEIRQKLTANFNSQVANSQIQAISTAKNQQKDFAAASYASLKDTTLKQANIDDINSIPGYVSRLEEVLRANVASGLVSAEEAQNELIEVDRKLRVDHVQAAIDSNPYAALSEITGDEGALGLSSSDLLKLKKEAKYGVAKADAIKASEEKAIKEKYQDLFEEVANASKRGNAINADLKEYLIESSRGTANEAEVDLLIDQNEIARNFSLYSVEDQLRIVRDSDAQGTNDPNLLGVNELLHDILDANVKASKEDPTAYAISKKFIPETPPLTFEGGLDDVMAQMDAKFQSAQSAKSLVGRDVTGMTKRDTKNWTAWFKTLSPADQSRAANAIISEYGNAAPAFMDTLQVTGSATIAGDMHTRKHDPELADKYADGEAILKAGDIKMPSNRYFTEAVTTSVTMSSNTAFNQQLVKDYKRMLAIKIQDGSVVLDSDGAVPSDDAEAIAEIVAPTFMRPGTAIKVGRSGTKLTAEQINMGFDNMGEDTINEKFGGINPNQIYGGETASSVVRKSLPKQEVPAVYSLVSENGEQLMRRDGTRFLVDVNMLPISDRKKASPSILPLDYSNIKSAVESGSNLIDKVIK